MIRGQLCLYVQSTDRHGWAAAGGVGIVEAPTGTFRPERILSFLDHPLNAGHLVAVGDYADQEVEDHGEEMADHVRSSQWPRPAPGTGIAGGGIMLRRTRVPAPQGREIMTLAVCMYAPAGTVAGQRLYSLTGRGDAGSPPDMLVMHDPEPCPMLAENGIGMTALLKRPAWGWESEKFALQSTMRLDVVDGAREVRRIMDLERPSDEERLRLEGLRHTPAWGVIRTARDEPMFDEFRRRMGCEAPFDDWSRPVSAAQLAARSARAEAVVRDLSREGHRRYA
jgi:hypothetical protein